MADSNPYRSPLAESSPCKDECSPQHSLAIGFLIDGAGALFGAIWLTSAPWLRLFLPFAAAHAVAGALIFYRARRNGQSLTAGDHFFLRYGAVIMAAATALLRAVI